MVRPGPVVTGLYVELPPPTLSDTMGDLQRLLRSIKQVTGVDQVKVELPALKGLGEKLRSNGWKARVVLADTGEGPRLLAVDTAPETSRLLGLAVDVGTTTLVADLVDLSTGQVLASCTHYNPQRRVGTDVTSRLIYAEEPGGLEEMHRDVVAELNAMVAGLANQAQVKPADIWGAVEAGNSIMTHILLGLDPTTIRREPYVPLTTDYPPVEAGRLGLNINPAGLVMCLPSASGYVGGDITAGLLATGVREAETLTVFVDIGTNGETALGNRDWLMACSGSAGSAFEGCGIQFGMYAAPGAIEGIEVYPGGEVRYRTVGNLPPRGLCGSGLIELLSSLMKAGFINRQGKLQKAAGPRVREGLEGWEFVVVPGPEAAEGRDIVLTQVDLDNLIRDKAALFAGSFILLQNAGISYPDIEKLLIAGNFGEHLNTEEAVRIGLLPDIPRERISFVGNTSLAGARAALLSRENLRKARDLARGITCLELTNQPGYYEAFVSALFLPHTDLSLFPSAS